MYPAREHFVYVKFVAFFFFFFFFFFITAHVQEQTAPFICLACIFVDLYICICLEV